MLKNLKSVDPLCILKNNSEKFILKKNRDTSECEYATNIVSWVNKKAYKLLHYCVIRDKNNLNIQNLKKKFFHFEKKISGVKKITTRKLMVKFKNN